MLYNGRQVNSFRNREFSLSLPLFALDMFDVQHNPRLRYTTVIRSVSLSTNILYTTYQVHLLIEKKKKGTKKKLPLLVQNSLSSPASCSVDPFSNVSGQVSIPRMADWTHWQRHDVAHFGSCQVLHISSAKCNVTRYQVKREPLEVRERCYRWNGSTWTGRTGCKDCLQQR